MDTQTIAQDGGATATAATMTNNFQKVLNSGVRLSGAASLYSLQQLETAVSNMQSGKGFSDQLNKVQATMDDVTKSLVKGLSQGKKDAVESVSTLGGQIIRQGIEGLAAFDPREMLRAANNLAQKSSETISHWVSRKPGVPAEEPRLAADVLAG
jgi:hypothetical protein